MFKSTKRFGPISTCHRNWMAETNPNRDSRKCAYIHGYSRYVQFTFQGDLDRHQWVQDFGDCKFIKEFIEANWDHRVLVAQSDPQLELLESLHEQNMIALTVIDDVNNNGWGPGIEGSCKHLYDVLQPIVSERSGGRVSIAKIEIWEHENNTASYEP